MGITEKYLASSMTYLYPREEKKLCLGLWFSLLTLVAMHILPPVWQEQKRGIFCCEMFSGLREEHRG